MYPRNHRRQRLSVSTLLAGAALPLVSLTSANPILPRATEPATFLPDPRVGPSQNFGRFKDSPHFRFYNPPSDSVSTSLLNSLESAYQCFVTDLRWRSTGLSFRQQPEDDSLYNGAYYKVNVYPQTSQYLGGSAANCGTDMSLGYSFLNVLPTYLTEASVTVHEYGHALTYAARYWIDQGRTGAWWETVANFVADTFLTHQVCAPARSRYSQPSNSNSLIDLVKVIGDSHQVIVDGSKNTGNYYQAWPFLTYMFNNPDNFTGLGYSIFPDMWTKYKRNSNETPLHVFERLLGGKARIQEVVARYWARMAFVDIGHSKARDMFNSQRGRLNYANLDNQGNGRWRVKSTRQPRYMGANIIPLKNASGSVSVSITVNNNMPYTAILAVKGTNGVVRYTAVDSQGKGSVNITNGEESALVVVNTPNQLYLYDPFSLTSEVSRGLDYTVQITGATV